MVKKSTRQIVKTRKSWQEARKWCEKIRTFKEVIYSFLKNVLAAAVRLQNCHVLNEKELANCLCPQRAYGLVEKWY